MAIANIQKKKTKIVATLGPACHDVDILANMIRAGMNCARFNFSHGSHEEHFERLQLLQKAEKITGQNIAIMLDTMGPEIRTGNLEDKEVILEKGKTIAVSGIIEKTNESIIALSYARIHKEVYPGTILKIADGSIILEVQSIQNTKLICTVIKDGILGSRKNVNIPSVKINLPSLMKKDIDDIFFAIEHKYDYIAASFIRNTNDVMAIRGILSEKESMIRIISKIENQEGLDNFEGILQVSDGIMVARGDLAEQIPSEEIPIRQKSIIKECNKNQKIVITATQMLQSMETSMIPTRAELTDVANAIFDGTDALMLSGESAKGMYPVEAIETMSRVALTVEKSEQFQDHIRSTSFHYSRDIFSEKSAGESIIAASQIVADKSNAKAIACPTLTGNTPRHISALRPTSQHIIATCHREYVCRQLLLVWGVIPVLTKEGKSNKDIIDTAIDTSRKLGFLDKNEKLIIVAGLPINKPLMINTIQMYFNGKVLLRGRQGIGPTVKGKIVHISSSGQISTHVASRKDEGYIYITQQLTYNMLPMLSGVSGLIIQHRAEVPLEILRTQYPNLTCLAYVNELTFQQLQEGQEIIISGKEKIAYEA